MISNYICTCLLYHGATPERLPWIKTATCTVRLCAGYYPQKMMEGNKQTNKFITVGVRGNVMYGMS